MDAANTIMAREGNQPTKNSSRTKSIPIYLLGLEPAKVIETSFRALKAAVAAWGNVRSLSLLFILYFPWTSLC